MKDLKLRSAEDLQASHTALSDELDLAQQKLDKQSRLVASIATRRNNIADEMNRRELEAMGNTPNWALLLTERPGASGKAAYQKLKELLSEMTGAKKGATGLNVSGYFLETAQRSLEVSLDQADAALTARVADALAKILPSIKPVTRKGAKCDITYKHISVFEHTLSLDQSYYLAIQENADSYELRSGLPHRPPLHKADTLLALLTYVQEHHPYVLSDSDDDSNT